MNRFMKWLLDLFRPHQGEMESEEERLARKYTLMQSEKELAADLKAKSVALEHQIAVAKAKNEAELAALRNKGELEESLLNERHKADLLALRVKQEADLVMLRTKCKQDIKDYNQYLNSLDQLKISIQASYPHLPEAVAFTIHHHAKHLLNRMWESQELEQKMQYEVQFIDFMATVHEEAHAYLEGLSKDKLPEKTLNLLQRK